ncbi:acetyltransferase [Psychrobacter sp. M13]|uniref:acetyltransferase n=1 Tax=Psychrobacter sp. M13 TaxID=3067275 RepID=UPI00273B6ED6|nr:acetyltransferase [Psychrobacter sp. M13]WLP95230.1 acetyltransferase [Psychrobacter sp. M13]
MLAILGASGHGKVLADIAELTGWSSIEFFDDAWPDNQHNGVWQIVGNTEDLLDNLESYKGVIVAIGNNKIRQQKLLQLHSAQANIVSLIHPSATVSKYTKIGLGSVVVAGAVINPDCIIGLGAIINTCSSVGHDCTLGDAVHICPGARIAGGTHISDRAWIGVGSSVRQLITIGEDAVIGAGAAVVQDVLPNITVVGVPARPKP